MYKIKQRPEDFVVKEISSLQVKTSGKYLYYTLIKKNKNTLEVVEELAYKLHLREKQIGFAGSKDKQAVTEQVISFRGVTKESIEKINLPKVSFQFFGYGDIPISLGDLERNYFEIIVRNINKENIKKVQYFPNYFDEQRFGSHNMVIGKHLIKKQFAEAVSLLAKPGPTQEYLKEKPHDYIGALKLWPLRLLRLFVNAYQSYLWNETLARYLRQKGTIIKEIPYSLGEFVFTKETFPHFIVPIIGFGGEDMTADAEIKTIIASLMAQEQITHPDFVIKQIPQLTLEGELRRAFVEVKDLTITEPEDDELNPGMKKVKVRFTLPKGSYATMAIKRMFG